MMEAAENYSDNVRYLHEPQAEYAPLTEILPVQLVNAQLIDAFWPLVRPLLDRCVREAMHGEMVVDDIRAMALSGQLSLMVFTNDRTGSNPYRTVELAIAIEPVVYPRLPAINIVAMGGTNFGLIQKKFWKMFRDWAYMNGARVIEASVSPAMLRILKRYGYEPVYTQVRYHLTEDMT